MRKELIYSLLVLILAMSFAGFKCGKKKAVGPVFNPPGIPLSKFCGQLQDFDLTPKGAKVSNCVGQTPTEYLDIVDDACNARAEAVKFYYPEWTYSRDASFCDVLLLEDDGVLTTVPNYLRPYLNVGGYTSAGTVMMNAERQIIVLPSYDKINYSNKHFEFHSVYNESEHASGFANRMNPPVNEWQNYLLWNDIHPQKPLLDEFVPDYAKVFPALVESNVVEDLSEMVFLTDDVKVPSPSVKKGDAARSGNNVRVERIDKEDAKKFFEYIDKLREDFLKKQK